MRIYIGLIVLTLFGFIWGCHSIQVSQDYDSSKDFSSLKTYEWQAKSQPKTGDIRVDNPLLDARIRSAITIHFRKRVIKKLLREGPILMSHINIKFAARLNQTMSR